MARRYFADSSVWNAEARDKGFVMSERLPASVHTWADTLAIDKSTEWSKRIFYAKDGDPEYRWTDVAGWVSGANIEYKGEPIPLPAGAHEATGSDGHLCIVSADRRKVWDFWRASVANKTAECIVVWDTYGSGVADQLVTSARGSGAPLINTVVRRTEDYTHAAGITVPNVEHTFTHPPATHSDGRTANGLHYGDLYVLRSSFAIPAGANDHTASLIKQLRRYGAYIVDQGSSLQIDAQPGIDLPSRLPIKASDFRKVHVA
jgi:hypothetical protein